MLSMATLMLVGMLTTRNIMKYLQPIPSGKNLHIYPIKQKHTSKGFKKTSAFLMNLIKVSSHFLTRHQSYHSTKKKGSSILTSDILSALTSSVESLTSLSIIYISAFLVQSAKHNCPQSIKRQKRHHRQYVQIRLYSQSSSGNRDNVISFVLSYYV